MSSKFYRRSIAVLLCLAIISSFMFGVSPSLPSTQAQEDSFFEEVDCAESFPFLADVEDVECGYLSVLENWNDPDSAEIELAVVIVDSISETPSDVPIFYLEGGPGGSAIFSADIWLDSPLRQDHVIVLFDQRGTGFSYPFLGCTEVADLPEDASVEEQDQAFADCRDALTSDGIDLSQYNSAASALDVQELRRALGFEQIDLFGVSYGTRLALTIMRDAPEGIRSVIIDSVYPPNVNAYEEEALNGGNAMLGIIDACMADADCNAEYPDLDLVFEEVVSGLNSNPATFENEDEDGEIYDETLDGDTFLQTIFEAIYSADYIPFVPLLIYEVSEGNFDTYRDFVNQDIAAEDDEDAEGFDYDALDEFSDLDDSDGMFYSVECSEEISFNDMDNADVLAEPLPDGLEDSLVASALGTVSICDIWNVPATDARENELVQSDIPTLILAGEFDPVTPPIWAFSAAEGLPNSFTYEFPGVGHGVLDSGDCATNIILDFLDDPTIEPNASCIDQITLEFE